MITRLSSQPSLAEEEGVTRSCCCQVNHPWQRRRVLLAHAVVGIFNGVLLMVCCWCVICGAICGALLCCWC